MYYQFIQVFSSKCTKHALTCERNFIMFRLLLGYYINSPRARGGGGGVLLMFLAPKGLMVHSIPELSQEFTYELLKKLLLVVSQQMALKRDTL